MAFKMKGFSYPGTSPAKMKQKTDGSKKYNDFRFKETTTQKERDYYAGKIDPDKNPPSDSDIAKSARKKKRYNDKMKMGRAEMQARKERAAQKKSATKLKKSPAKMKKSPTKKSYDQAYDALPASEKKKYFDKSSDGNARKAFKAAAKKYNEKKYGTTEPTRESKVKNISKKQLAKNKKDIEVTKKINKRKTDANDKKVQTKQKITSDVTKKKMTEGTTRKRTTVGKLAVKTANIFRKNKKDPNRVKDNSKVKANKKAEKKAAKVNKKLDKITAKREKNSSKKDMTVKQARRANKKNARLAAKANKIQAKAKKKLA